jgi:hypothetical protein
MVIKIILNKNLSNIKQIDQISGGVVLKKGISDLGFWKYIMVPVPDKILIELFQVDRAKLPPQYLAYFRK